MFSRIFCLYFYHIFFRSLSCILSYFLCFTIKYVLSHFFYVFHFHVTAQLTNVAFTVSASSYHTDWRNTKVVYDKVITNIGSGYSLQTGIFTCPRDGDYVFTWSTMSNSGGQNCYAFIYRNGVRSLETFSEENGGSIYEHASTTVVFHLSMGDKVWIQTSGCVYFQGYPYTAFSGWKL